MKVEDRWKIAEIAILYRLSPRLSCSDHEARYYYRRSS